MSMKISCINAYKAPAFKSQNPDGEFVLGYDDEISKMRRQHIREHYYDDIMPYQSIYEREKRLEEFELNKLIGSLLGKKLNTGASSGEIKQKPVKPNEINSELMYKLSVYNVKPIYGTNSWRGSIALKDSDLILLKKAGIKTVIPLSYDGGLEESCKKYDLNYLYFNSDFNMFRSDAFKSEENIRAEEILMGKLYGYEPSPDSVAETWKGRKNNFIDEFVKFIQTMQQDNVYVGCEFGTNTTDNMLMLNNFFNPYAKNTKTYINRLNSCYVPYLQTFVQNMTQEHKNAMGWTKEFEKEVLAKISKYAKF